MPQGFSKSLLPLSYKLVDIIGVKENILRIFIIIYLLTLVIIGKAVAANIPEYDIKAFCREIAALDGDNVIIERQCRQDEASAKAHIARMNVPEAVMRRCTEIAAVEAQEMYVILEQCIQEELRKPGG